MKKRNRKLIAGTAMVATAAALTACGLNPTVYGPPPAPETETSIDDIDIGPEEELEIEQMRFEDALCVRYDITCTDFGMPALTLEPLVENAIRHGVRSREDGLVTVSTVREAGAHRITVRDNGVGFDPKHQQDESHIGLQNVKERVERMCGGTVIVESEMGAGTVVTLLIPDTSQNDMKERGQ